MTRYIGETIGGYRIIEPIGAGGMAKVFKAYQPAFDRFVALKVLPDHYAEDPTYVERFKQEAKIIAKLEHRHILPVYDFGEDQGITYLAMRYLQAGTLKDVIKQCGGTLPLADAARLIAQVAQALDYGHAQGIIHRDVKPSNVLVDAQGDAFLTDFGIAKVLEGTAHLTATGGAMGTPAYMSPEQGAGQRIDARSDIYSLGVMLYEMVVGRVPFEADTPLAVILAHANDALPLPSALNPQLPEAVERVIFKALAKKPEDRYQTAGQLANELTQAVTGVQIDPAQSALFLNLAASMASNKPSEQMTFDVPIAAKPKTMPRAPRSPRTLLIIGAITGGVILIGAIGALLFLLGRASSPESALVAAQNVTSTAQAAQNATATTIALTPLNTHWQADMAVPVRSVVNLEPEMTCIPPTVAAGLVIFAYGVGSGTLDPETAWAALGRDTYPTFKVNNQALEPAPRFPLDPAKKLNTHGVTVALQNHQTQLGLEGYAGIVLPAGTYSVEATWPRADGNLDPRGCTLTVK